MNNLKQFLEARALLPCPFCGNTEPLAREECGEILVDCQQCEASVWLDRWNTRTPDRNLLAAFEQVCEALEALQPHVRTYATSRKARQSADAALAAAAPYRKGGV